MIGSPLIEIRNGVKSFKVGGGLLGSKRSIRAVDNVSFIIGKGDIVALVGESGCGKTTLGRLTLALERPTSGQILYEGKKLWSMKKVEFEEYRRNAQLIHQDPYKTLNPMRTIYQSLSPPLRHYKIAHDEEDGWRRAAELLELVGVAPPDDFLNRYPSRLSGGQMQRIAIARAVSVSPKFLVADEAVSMIDASLRIEILDLLLDLEKRFNMACLFITHDLGVTRYFARSGRIMVMYLGNIVEIGDTEDVIQKPLHPYTKALVAATPLLDPVLTRQRFPSLRSLEVPKLTEVPPGCKFHPRCPYAEDICAQKTPEPRVVSGERMVACHFV